MNFYVVSASDMDIDLLINRKIEIILEYADNLSFDEIEEIKEYSKNEVCQNIDHYQIVKCDNNIVGSVLVVPYLDGVMMDDLYIREEFRNNGIGTKIIHDILFNHDCVYLWVYKNNIKAVSLYKRMGFSVIEETLSRYFMKYQKEL